MESFGKACVVSIDNITFLIMPLPSKPTLTLVLTINSIFVHPNPSSPFSNHSLHIKSKI